VRSATVGGAVYRGESAVRRDYVTDAQDLLELSDAFASCARPQHFTNFRHCCECAEHDELLRWRDRDTLRVEDVGNPVWDLCETWSCREDLLAAAELWER
jgi:hypothetical protein